MGCALGYIVLIVTYSSSDNLAPPISQVMIGRHLTFCSMTSPTCCNSSLKCTPAKCKARQKVGFQLSHTQLLNKELKISNKLLP